MAPTSQEADDSSGFKTLAVTFADGGSTGEGYMEAPDGSVFHIEWDRPGNFHFEEVPLNDADESIPISHAKDEILKGLLPDLAKGMEQGGAFLTKSYLDSTLPGLLPKWEAWRATQSE